MNHMQLKPYKKHFNQIDSALKRENSLKDELWKSCKDLRLGVESELTKEIIFKTILWIVFTGLLTLLSYLLFDADTILISLIVSLIVITPLMFMWLSSSIKETMNSLSEQIVEKEKATYKQIVSMYSNLLSSINVYEFLSIPEDLRFDKDNLPYYATKSVMDKSHLRDSKYGLFTRYVSNYSGRKYHIKEGCSGAYSPIHAYKIALATYYAPCQRCIGYKDEIIIPEWYEYYLKIKKISDEYNIKIDFSVRFKEDRGCATYLFK